MAAHAETPARHIVLVGLPGSGKTTVGRAAADRLGRRFMDFDEEIERRAGKTVAEIFAAEGEAGFRWRERQLTTELASRTGMVLSAGGGWITNRDALDLLRAVSRLVYLQVSPVRAVARMGKDTGKRPLLAASSPVTRVEALYHARRAAYESADAKVDTELLTLEQVIDEVVALAR